MADHNSVPISVNNVSYNMKILIIPSVTYALILGMDFLKIINIDANFQDLSYTLLSSLCVINTIHSASTLSPFQSADLQRVMTLLSDLAPKGRLGLTHLMTHHIETGNEKPISQRQYPLSSTM